MENRSGKWHASAHCNWTRRDSVAEAARPVAVETNFRVRRRHTPTAPAVVANRLQEGRLIYLIDLSKDHINLIIATFYI